MFIDALTDQLSGFTSNLGYTSSQLKILGLTMLIFSEKTIPKNKKTNLDIPIFENKAGFYD